MIYTCYEMARDCRANLPEGWSFFVTHYVPAVRKLLQHYASGDEALLDRVLVAIGKPDSSLFQTLEPVPERCFLAELRQKVMGELAVPRAEIELDLETVAEALEPLTMVEKQAAWTEVLRYSPEATGPMLRMEPGTVLKIRNRAGDLIRGKVDRWSRSLMVDNGWALSRAAAPEAGKDCLTTKTFLDILDGRMTWRGREELERHVNGCWHCIDHFCRMLEVVELLRGLTPLTDAEAAPYRKLLGLSEPKKAIWKRFLGAG